MKGLSIEKTIVLTALFCLAVSFHSSAAETGRADNLLLLDAVLAGERIITVGERGSILISDDNGKSWRRVKTPVESTLTSVYFLDKDNGWAVGHDAVILRSQDGGETWQVTHAAPEKEAPLLDVLFIDSRHGFAVGAYGTMYETYDGGRTWRQRNAFGDDFHKNSITASRDGNLFIAGEAGTIYTSDDMGKTWRRLPSPYHGSYFTVLSTDDGAVLIAGLRGKIYRSKDRGMTWSAVRTESEASIFGGFSEKEHTVLVGHEGTILISSNYGKTFSLKKTHHRNVFSSALILRDGKIMLVGETGAVIVEK